MRFDRAAITCLLGGLVAGGCNLAAGRRDPYGSYKLGPARNTIAAAVDAIGGVDAWKHVTTIHASAMVTVYDEHGTAHVDRQQHAIDLRGGKIASRGVAARGTWTADVRDDGTGSVSASGFAMDDESERRIIGSLSPLAHHVRGPLNFLYGRERGRAAEQVKIGENELVRVGVDGDNRRAIAYYFDPLSGMLRMMTSDADSPGKDGTVTLYTYEMLPDGIGLPTRIRVVRIGRHVLLGEQPVMEVEYSNVRVR